MLGETHMATGLLASGITLPVMESIHLQAWLSQVSHGKWTNIETGVLWIGLCVAGSIIPDLDEIHSIGTRRVEALIRLALLALLLLLAMQHGGFSPLSGMILTIGVLTLFGGEMARKVTMLLIVIASVMLGVLNMKYGTGFLAGTILIALWSGITAFVAHRTFTHSLLGMFIMGVGLDLALLPLREVVLVYPVMIGYLMHLLADAVSGGVPVLWPLE